MKVAELKEQKRALGYTNEMVAKLSGVPLGTVQKVFSGATASPRYETLRAIERVLFPDTVSDAVKEDAGRSSYQEILERRKAQGMLSVCEPSNLAYAYEDNVDKEQGSYTTEDYNNLPEGIRAELIDGVLYDMETPTYVHQFLLGEIYSGMQAFRKQGDHPCLPFLAPLSVQLDCDDKTMVEPDLMVLCDRGKLQNGIIHGAPDLVLEILSPSTRSRDMLLKFNKYWHAGVREYWIVDSEKEIVTVYCFDPMQPTAIYSFEDQIPVRISEGKLCIDMKEISAQMKLLLPEE